MWFPFVFLCVACLLRLTPHGCLHSAAPRQLELRTCRGMILPDIDQVSETLPFLAHLLQFRHRLTPLLVVLQDERWLSHRCLLPPATMLPRRPSLSFPCKTHLEAARLQKPEGTHSLATAKGHSCLARTTPRRGAGKTHCLSPSFHRLSLRFCCSYAIPMWGFFLRGLAHDLGSTCTAAAHAAALSTVLVESLTSLASRSDCSPQAPQT